MATIIQAFENNKQYEIELISNKTCLLAEYLHQLILGEYLRVTTIMKNMATIIQAFENNKQYEIELISIHIIPYFRLLVYGVLTTDNVNFLCQHFSF